MEEEKNIPDGYVKKETVVVVSIIALIVGFLGGIVLTIYKSGSGLPFQRPAPSRSGDKDQAVSPENAAKIFELENKLSKTPDDVEAWTRLGNLYFDNNTYDKAIWAYEKSLALNPDNADVLTDLGVMYRRSGRPEEAIKSFDQAIKVDPRHEVSRFNKGVVLMHDLNDMEGAMKAWEALVALNPSAMSSSGQSVKEMVEKFKKTRE
jgi:cytochrome c-type biogenesis protein CcmH/NrfG